jgi:ABC-2 type transport system ATP-binding protein/lipopolysaccharide transport system ATP-binding protein
MIDGLVIDLRSVSVKYRLTKEKPQTFQEYVVNRIRGKRMVFEDFWALSDLNLQLHKGDVLGIIGSNGAGKSTMLKVLAGVLKPTRGNVTVNGMIAPLIELGAGFDMDLTGKENIYLNASILGFSRREIDKRFNSIVDFSELGEFLYSPLRSFSSGMVSRLGFSIATELDPDILLIDEILSVGDEHFKRKCEKRILEFKMKGTTMLFVSHSMEEVKRLCNKVCWLDHGISRMWGEAETVVHEYLKYVNNEGSVMPPELP